MTLSGYEAAIAILALVSGLMVAGPQRVASELRVAFDHRRSVFPALIIGGAILGFFAIAARHKVSMFDYAASAALSTVSFIGLWFLALRLDGVAAWLRTTAQQPPWIPALFVFLAALAAKFLLFDGIPHVSDELAYQFQSRAFATGQLGFEVPQGREFFIVPHTTFDGGLWHSVMNPGWPMLLAVGQFLGLPFLVNPLLGAAALPLLHSFLRQAEAGRLAAGVTVWALATSPFYVVMASTTMAHSSSFFLFSLFLWGWIRVWRTGDRLGAILAGLALGIGFLVRPLDAVVTALPFGLVLAWRCVHFPRWIPSLLLVGGFSLIGPLGTLAYNQALTGDALEFPQTRYFDQRFPGERFGMGFGPDMGTKIHGDEWPGYHISDAPRVTSQRMLRGLRDSWGLPWLTLVGIVLALGAKRAPIPLRTLGAAGLALLAAYVAHFYDGIAYGARHYFLAMAPAALALGAMAAAGLAGRAGLRHRVGAAVVAWVAHVLLFALPPQLATYHGDYWSASPALELAVEEAGLDQALVFVAQDPHGWKSAFPLNEFPLNHNSVLFALDRGAANDDLRALHPERVAWRAERSTEDVVRIERMPETLRLGPGNRP